MTLAELRAAGWRFRYVEGDDVYGRAPNGYDYLVLTVFDSGGIEHPSELCRAIADLLNGTDPRIAAAIAVAEQYNTPGVNVGAHELAVKILKCLRGESNG